MVNHKPVVVYLMYTIYGFILSLDTSSRIDKYQYSSNQSVPLLHILHNNLYTNTVHRTEYRLHSVAQNTRCFLPSFLKTIAPFSLFDSVLFPLSLKAVVRLRLVYEGLKIKKNVPNVPLFHVTVLSLSQFNIYFVLSCTKEGNVRLNVTVAASV